MQGGKIVKRILCAFLCLSLGACAASGPAFNPASHSKPVSGERGKLIVFQGSGPGTGYHPIYVGREKLGILRMNGFLVYQDAPGEYVVDTSIDANNAGAVFAAAFLRTEELKALNVGVSTDPITIGLEPGQTVYVELEPNAKEKVWLARCGEDKDSINVCERKVSVPQFEIRAEEDALKALAGLKESN